jgi:hypothetical protein
MIGLHKYMDYTNIWITKIYGLQNIWITQIYGLHK